MVSIYAISDPHLPVKTQVSKFNVPTDYFQRVSSHLEQVNPDILLIAGDLVWGLDISEIKVELNLIRELPGKFKFFVEGNHDSWVDRLNQTYSNAQKKMYELFSTLDFYYIGGRARIVTLDTIKIGICGARGFAFDNYEKPIVDENLFRKNELESLDKSLSELKDINKTEKIAYNICLLHYPPTMSIYKKKRKGDEEFINHIHETKLVNKIIFGHIHLDEDLQLYSKNKDIELLCTTLDKNNYLAVRVS